MMIIRRTKVGRELTVRQCIALDDVFGTALVGRHADPPRNAVFLSFCEIVNCAL